MQLEQNVQKLNLLWNGGTKPPQRGAGFAFSQMATRSMVVKSTTLTCRVLINWESSMTGQKATREGVGGEILCDVW